jgi:hypothetical protein
MARSRHLLLQNGLYFASARAGPRLSRVGIFDILIGGYIPPPQKEMQPEQVSQCLNRYRDCIMMHEDNTLRRTLCFVVSKQVTFGKL